MTFRIGLLLLVLSGLAAMFVVPRGTPWFTVSILGMFAGALLALGGLQYVMNRNGKKKKP